MRRGATVVLVSGLLLMVSCGGSGSTGINLHVGSSAVRPGRYFVNEGNCQKGSQR